MKEVLCGTVARADLPDIWQVSEVGRRGQVQYVGMGHPRDLISQTYITCGQEEPMEDAAARYDHVGPSLVIGHTSRPEASSG